MKINRLELIVRVREMIVAAETAAEARKVKAYEDAENAETKYVQDTSDHWSAFATTIRSRVRRGQAITTGDVPDGLLDRYHGVKLFSPTTVQENRFVPRTEILTRLLAVLESCTDDTLSTTVLTQLGAPLKDLMRP